MRFKLFEYQECNIRCKKIIYRDINNAAKLQKDARLITQGLDAEKLKMNLKNYNQITFRILSEVYKDVEALRTFKFYRSRNKRFIKRQKSFI